MDGNDLGKDKSGNVVEISEAKNLKRKKKKSENTEELSSFDRRSLKFIEMAEIIDTGLLGVKFHVIENEGTRFVVRELPNKVVTYVNEDQIISLYLSYAIKQASFDASTPTRLAEATEIIRKWKYTADTIPEPKKIAFNSEDTLCFKRLDFDYDPAVNDYYHPTWDIILNNIESNKSAFMQFIGSIFFEESYNQQYLWLYGAGGDGKGSLLKFLSNVLGSCCKSMVEDIGDTHWSAKLVGARVAYFSDCRNYGITNTGKFMALTGGDAIPINPKYQQPFEITNNIKFIFASNNKPKIDHVASSLRRLIVVPFRAKSELEIKDSQAFEAGLNREGKEFLHQCIAMYLAACKNHCPINLDHDYNIELITREAEADKIEFVEKYFGVESLEKDQEFIGKEDFVYAVKQSTVTALVREHFKNQNTTIIKEWLNQRYGVKLHNRRVNCKLDWYYFGLRLLKPHKSAH